MAMIVQTDDPAALTPEETPPYELCRKESGLQSRSESFKKILPHRHSSSDFSMLQ